MDFHAAMETFAEAWVAANTQTAVNPEGQVKLLFFTCHDQIKHKLVLMEILTGSGGILSYLQDLLGGILSEGDFVLHSPRQHSIELKEK